MEITKISLSLVEPKDNLVAYASVEINRELSLNKISVYRRVIGSGYRIAFPADEGKPIFCPLSLELIDKLESAINDLAMKLICEAS